MGPTVRGQKGRRKAQHNGRGVEVTSPPSPSPVAPLFSSSSSSSYVPPPTCRHGGGHGGRGCTRWVSTVPRVSMARMRVPRKGAHEGAGKGRDEARERGLHLEVSPRVAAHGERHAEKHAHQDAREQDQQRVVLLPEGAGGGVAGFGREVDLNIDAACGRTSGR